MSGRRDHEHEIICLLRDMIRVLDEIKGETMAGQASVDAAVAKIDEVLAAINDLEAREGEGGEGAAVNTDALDVAVADLETGIAVLRGMDQPTATGTATTTATGTGTATATATRTATADVQAAGLV